MASLRNRGLHGQPWSGRVRPGEAMPGAGLVGLGKAWFGLGKGEARRVRSGPTVARHRKARQGTRRLVICVYCGGVGWRYVDAARTEFVRCPECAGTGDFESREDES